MKLNYRDGVYLIDSAGDRVPGISEKNVLTWMVQITCYFVFFANGLTQGTLLEKFLTHSPSDFLRLTRSFDDTTAPAVDDTTAPAEESKREAYRYAKVSLRLCLSSPIHNISS